jgi:hypothetical protein
MTETQRQLNRQMMDKTLMVGVAYGRRRIERFAVIVMTKHLCLRCDEAFHSWSWLL